MPVAEALSIETLKKLAGRTIIVITEGASQGPNLTVGIIQEITESGDWISVRYIPKRCGAGDPDNLNEAKWRRTSPLFTYTTLGPRARIEDDGTVVFEPSEARRVATSARIVTAEVAKRVYAAKLIAPIA